MRFCRAISITICGLAWAIALPAQQHVERFRWPHVSIIVAGDSADGVLLWATPSYRAISQGSVGVTCLNWFTPEATLRWLLKADSLLALTDIASGDTATTIATPYMVSTAGDQVMLARRRDGHRWSRVTYWYCGSADTAATPLMFASSNENARSVLSALRREARQSMYQPEGARAVASFLPGSRCPTLPNLDNRLPRGIEEWGSVIADTAGRPIASSYRTYVMDNPLYSGAVRAAVTSGRFPTTARPHRYFFLYFH